MAVAGSWDSDTPELFTATRWDWTNQAWIFLIAEAMPDGSWDWAAWSSDNTCGSLHGVATDRGEAMAQAERAAELIGQVR